MMLLLEHAAPTDTQPYRPGPWKEGRRPCLHLSIGKQGPSWGSKAGNCSGVAPPTAAPPVPGPGMQLPPSPFCTRFSLSALGYRSSTDSGRERSAGLGAGCGAGFSCSVQGLPSFLLEAAHRKGRTGPPSLPPHPRPGGSLLWSPPQN